MAHKQKDIILIAGPTASGKSALALDIANKIDGVIINADSVQIYKELHVLSARPTIEDEKKSEHRLYGIMSIKEHCSVAQWRDMAMTEIQNAFDKNKKPILCGGTGLYFKALVEGLPPLPQVPYSVRKATMNAYDNMGGDAFKEQLYKHDPDLAEKLHANDRQRLIRAWEVFAHTGKPLSYYQNLAPISPPPEWHFKAVVLFPPRQDLYNKIDRRFDTMMDHGILDEAHTVEALSPDPLLPSLKAHGLPALRAHIRGELNQQEAIERAKTDTRHYAKRQFTWFKHQLINADLNHLDVTVIQDFGKNITFDDLSF